MNLRNIMGFLVGPLPPKSIGDLEAELATLKLQYEERGTHLRSLAGQLGEANDAKMALAEQLARVSEERDAALESVRRAFYEGYEKGWSEWLKQEASNKLTTIEDAARLARYGAALDAIGATESRNGTAQRLARLAREARE